MKRLMRVPVLTGALAITFCLASLGPLTSKEASAQVIVVPGNPQPYYNGYGAGFNGYGAGYNGYGAVYNGYGAGYNSPYQNGYARYGAANYRYTVYGNGPYVYGSPGVYGYSTPDSVYGASYGPDNRGLRYGGATYPRAYAPSTSRFYSPYGIQSPYGRY